MKTFKEYLEDVESIDANFQTDFVAAGKFVQSGKSEDDFDQSEIEKGIKVEMEHTNKKEIAKRIALDHIAESWPVSYYDKLEAMENEIKKELAK